MYAIIQTYYKDKFYLNHAYLGSLSFGSADMAWTTDDKHEAEQMAKKCRTKHKARNIKAVEIY